MQLDSKTLKCPQNYPQIAVLRPAFHSSGFQITLFRRFELRTLWCRVVLVEKVHQNAVKLEKLKMIPKLPQIEVLRPAAHSSGFQNTLFLRFDLRTLGCRGVLVGKVHQNAVKLEN